MLGHSLPASIHEYFLSCLCCACLWRAWLHLFDKAPHRHWRAGVRSLLRLPPLQDEQVQLSQLLTGQVLQPLPALTDSGGSFIQIFRTPRLDAIFQTRSSAWVKWWPKSSYWQICQIVDSTKFWQSRNEALGRTLLSCNHKITSSYCMLLRICYCSLHENKVNLIFLHRKVIEWCYFGVGK